MVGNSEGGREGGREGRVMEEGSGERQREGREHRRRKETENKEDGKSVEGGRVAERSCVPGRGKDQLALLFIFPRRIKTWSMTVSFLLVF